MKVGDIIDFLEDIAPLHLQENYDNAGLLTGRIDWEATGAVICLDATEQVIKEAQSLGYNMVIAHHPIIFGGLKSLTGKHYVERAIIRAIKNDIAIYAIHTNLDNVLDRGVNEVIAQKLKLQEVSILQPKGENPDIGSGAIGYLTEALPFDKFIQHLKEQMELLVVKHTKMVKPVIEKVALCGGSGRFLLDTAIEQEADVFISSDFKYHEYFEANDQITIFDIGHYESEKYTIEHLHKLLTGNFSKFAACCTKVHTNPIKYS